MDKRRAQRKTRNTYNRRNNIEHVTKTQQLANSNYKNRQNKRRYTEQQQIEKQNNNEQI